MTNLHNRIDDRSAARFAEATAPARRTAPHRAATRPKTIPAASWTSSRETFRRVRRGPEGSGGRKPPSRVSWLYFLLACALVGYMAMSMGGAFQGGSNAKELSTSEFVTAVKDDRVDSVVYTVIDGTMTGEYWPEDAAHDDKNLVPVTSTYVGSDSLSELMAKHPDTTYTVDTDDPNFWSDLVMTLLPTLRSSCS